MKINPEAQLAVKLYRQYLEAHINDGLNDPESPAVDIKALCEIAERESVLDAAKLCSLARSIRRLDESDCNRELKPNERSRRLKLVTAASRAAGKYGLELTHNSDLRGYAVYLHFPDGSHNSMGGAESGWGI